VSPTYPTYPRELKFPYSPFARYDVDHGPYLQTARIGEPLSYASGYAEARLEPERAPISFLNRTERNPYYLQSIRTASHHSRRFLLGRHPSIRREVIDQVR
jgi:hypothetical protein